MMSKFFTTIILIIAAGLLVTAGNLGMPSAAAQVETPAATDVESIPPLSGSGKISGPLDSEAKTLNGSGATFPLNLYLNWAKTYKDLTGVTINYPGGGSGKGRKDIVANVVDFAGSDFPMSDDEVKLATDNNGPILHIPMTIGAIVAVYNIPELKGKDPLNLTGDELAQIYLGAITKWNDPKLVADNPNLYSINQTIVPAYRSDSSGTTQNFTTYLSMVNPDFASKIKSGAQVDFPVGTGSPGSAGLSQAVKAIAYSIGYVELSFTQDLPVASIKNASGKFIVPNADSMSKAVLGVKIDPDLRTVILGKSTDPDAYPISVYTWILVYTNQKDTAKAIALTRFLWWATHDGQQYNASLGYAPLPSAAVALDEAQILKIQVNGQQALPIDIATPTASN